MKFLFLFVILGFINGCSSVRDSAGASRKIIDEYQVVENPPLVIPPDFNLMPPDQLEEKDMQNIESDLAKEILFGLDDVKIDNKENSSVLDIILKQVDIEEVSPNIREEIDQGFQREIKVDNFLEDNWENQDEVLDAIKESERIRNNNFEGKSINDGDTPTILYDKNDKKKKRFIFF